MEAADPAEYRAGRLLAGLLGVGIALLLLQCLTALTATRFGYEIAVDMAPVHGFVTIQILAGAIFLFAISLLPKRVTRPGLLLTVVVLGLAMRLVLL